jgi:hypothetical protein
VNAHATRPATGLALGDERIRRILLSLGAGLLLAGLTSVYVFFAGSSADVRALASYAPFLLPAAVVGVAPASYIALDMFDRKQWLPAAAASAVALLVAFVVFWSAAIAATPRPQEIRMDRAAVIVSRPFASAAWLRYPDLRDRMVTDLIQSRRLIGMTPAQVSAQLGEPARILGPGGRRMRYSIGQRAGGRPVALDVFLDSNGRVEKVAVQP